MASVGINTDAFRTHERVFVPLPPSTNHLFRTTEGKRFKTREYKAWLAKATPSFMTMRRPQPPVQLMLLYHGPLNRARDGDNMVKPILDALVANGVLPEDNLRIVAGCSWQLGDPNWSGVVGPEVEVWFQEVR